jgi:asparagine synthase (glutamine-hydrolysing)
MCGIFGVLRLDGKRPDPAHLARMASALTHRGRHGAAQWLGTRCALGLVRLATVGVAQPARVFDRGRVHAAVNGEIYGHSRVAAALGFPVPPVDTELVALAAQRGGPAQVLELPGTFAAAWWDGTSLWLARDRVGKKPLFVAATREAVWFASEVKALLAARAVEAVANPHAVGRFLVQGALEEEMPLVAGVTVVPPGTAWGFTRGGETRRVDARPWDLRDDAGTSVDALRALLEEAVDQRLPAEVSGVTMFSGGLDSTLVAARARLPLLTIAVPESDETEGARAGAEALGLALTVVPAPPRTQAWLRRALHHLETPDASAAYAMAPAVMAAADVLAEQGVTVALGGEGADEIFLGYPWQRIEMARERGRLPKGAEEVFARRVGERLGDRVDGGSHRPLEAWLRAGPLSDGVVDALLGQPVPVGLRPAGHVPMPGVPHSARQRQLDALRRDMLLLPVLHSDRLMMAAGIEPRLPFLDGELVAAALRAPARALERLDRDKPLLRAMAARMIPGFRAAAKRGFTAPRRPPDDVLVAWSRTRARLGATTLDLERLLALDLGAAGLEALWRAFLVEETLDVLRRGPLG